MEKPLPLRVLVVSPVPSGYPPLNWTQEISCISGIEGIVLEIVGGDLATANRIATKLGQPWDVILWTGHGLPNTLVLSDGSTIGAKWLATQAKAARPFLVVLSACMSGVTDPDTMNNFSYALSRAGLTSVTMLAKIEDRSAITYDVELLRALRAGADVSTAHEVAQDCVRESDPDQAATISLMPGLTNGYRAIMIRLDSFDKRLEDLSQQINSLRESMEKKRR